MSKFLLAFFCYLTTATSSIESDSDGLNSMTTDDFKSLLIGWADSIMSIKKVYKELYDESLDELYKVVGPARSESCPDLDDYIQALVDSGAAPAKEKELSDYLVSGCDRQFVHKEFRLAVSRLSSDISKMRNSQEYRRAKERSELTSDLDRYKAELYGTSKLFEDLQKRIVDHDVATQRISSLMNIWSRSASLTPSQHLENFREVRSTVTSMFATMYRSGVYCSTDLQKYLNSLGIELRNRPRMYYDLCQTGFDIYVTRKREDMKKDLHRMQLRMEALTVLIAKKNPGLLQVQKDLEKY